MIGGYDGYRQRGLQPALHRGLPSPFLTLIFTIHEPLTLALHVDGARGPTSYRSLLGGLHTAPAVVAHEGAQSGIQVRLSPLGARSLLGLPAGELARLDLQADEVLPGFADELQHRIAEARDWEGRFELMDRMLLRRLGHGGGIPSPPLAEAWRMMLVAGGRLPVAAVARAVGWSERRLAQRFSEDIGLGPKQAARVIRFDHARRVLSVRASRGARRDLDIGRVAVDCGYFDHAHLDRDFRAFAGVSPTRWLAEEFRFVQDEVLAGT